MRAAQIDLDQCRAKPLATMIVRESSGAKSRFYTNRLEPFIRDQSSWLAVASNEHWALPLAREHVRGAWIGP